MRTCTVQVATQYKPANALDNWPRAAVGATQFDVQYGLADLLAPFPLAWALQKDIKQEGLKVRGCVQQA